MKIGIVDGFFSIRDLPGCEDIVAYDYTKNQSIDSSSEVRNRQQDSHPLDKDSVSNRSKVAKSQRSPGADPPSNTEEKARNTSPKKETQNSSPTQYDLPPIGGSDKVFRQNKDSATIHIVADVNFQYNDGIIYYEINTTNNSLENVKYFLQIRLLDKNGNRLEELTTATYQLEVRAASFEEIYLRRRAVPFSKRIKGQLGPVDALKTSQIKSLKVKIYEE